MTAHGLERGEWRLWDAESGKIITEVPEPTANFDNAVRVYDAKNRKLLAYRF